MPPPGRNSATIVSGINDLQTDHRRAGKGRCITTPTGDPYDHAKHIRDHVLPGMAEVRKAADKLETIVADDLWPLPTYREMLFIK